MEFKYGDSWEKFPMKQGELWGAGDHRLQVMDITKESCLSFFADTDLIYTDPPWNLGNTKSFYTKNGQKGEGDFVELLQKLIVVFKQVSLFYCEMGKQHVNSFVDMIRAEGGVVTDIIDIMYYKINPCKLIRGSFQGRTTPLSPEQVEILTGVDDDMVPILVLKQIETWVETIGDPCTGLGVTGKAAHLNGKRYRGTELNGRRIANLIEWFSKKGNSVSKL